MMKVRLRDGVMMIGDCLASTRTGIWDGLVYKCINVAMTGYGVLISK